MRTTTAAPVRRGFFPLDQRLGLLKHNWTPATIQEAVSMGVEIPSYRRAAERYTSLTKVPMSKSSLERLVGEFGGALVAEQAAEAEAMVQVPTQEDVVVWREVPEPASEVMAISMDGVLLNIVDEGWKEVKVVSVSAVGEGISAKTGEAEVQLTQHSYRAGLWDAATFAKQQWAETCRRGCEKAKQLVSINDGAHWIWLIVLMCYAPCVEILDWWHAVEKLWLLANDRLGQGQAAAVAWVAQQKRLLASDGLRTVLSNIRTLCPRTQPLPETVRQVAGYFFTNRLRMRYQTFRQLSLPIGSGVVESSCKSVVEARMKQAGMRWSVPGAQAMLALRCALLSDRWEETWQQLSPQPTSA